jgi:hypothetical protein
VLVEVFTKHNFASVPAEAPAHEQALRRIHKGNHAAKDGSFYRRQGAENPAGELFDPKKHSFNPLAGIDYKKARQIADVLYTISPQGENTLTVRNGKRALLKALLAAKSFDKLKGDEEVQGMIDDILVSPVLRRVLCQPTNFSFGSDIILAKLNRAELGDFDMLVLGLSRLTGRRCKAAEDLLRTLWDAFDYLRGSPALASRPGEPAGLVARCNRAQAPLFGGWTKCEPLCQFCVS